jgi:hypothetical protein
MIAASAKIRLDHRTGIAAPRWRRHDYAMGRDPAEQATPDLLSTNTVGDASPPPPKRGSTEAATETAPQRHILPKNLRIAVKYLSDTELDLMHAATFEEMKRRGRKPPSVETLRHRLNVRPGLMKIKSSLTEKRRHEDNGQVSLTRGQVNAVRSAFKAGITPARIARQFGISLSNVRKALASDELKR